MPEEEAQPSEEASFENPASDALSLHAARFSKAQPYFDVPPMPAVGDSQDKSVSDISQDADDDQELHPAPEPHWVTIAKAAGVFCVAFIVFFVLLQAPAYYRRAQYTLTHLSSKSSAAVTFSQLPTLQDKPVTLTDIKADPSRFQSAGAFAGYSLADLGDNTLLIPKIDVKAPIIWGSAADETSMLASLQKGVAHYGFTAYPSDGQGNVFIAGHSSYLIWDKGKYKDVFANLDRLVTGDQAAVTYKGLVYIYQVTNTKVVQPTDTSVLAQTADPTLTLMTCVPVGTSKNRLIVSFKLVSASPSTPIEVPAPSNVDPAAIFHYLTFTNPANSQKTQ